MCFAEVTVAEGNPHFTSSDGFLIDTRTGTLLHTSPSSAGRPLPAVRRLGAWSLYHWAAWDADVVIPEGVEEIGPAAFYDVGVASLQLPQSLRRIETDAFFAFDIADGRVVIPAGVEVVEFAAFGSGYVDGASGLEYWHLTILPESESTRFETAQEYEARTGNDSFSWWYD